MPKRSDVRALKSFVDQAYLVAATDPMPRGGMESIRENLDAARKLVRLLLVKTDNSAAVELGTRGGNETAKRGADYYKQIAGMRKERKGGRPKKYEDVFTNGEMPSKVRSRAAFVIAARSKELGLSLEALAKAISVSVQYARDLVQGKTIPSDEKVRTIIKGLDLDDAQTDQLRTVVAEDRRWHDGRFSKDKA